MITLKKGLKMIAYNPEKVFFLPGDVVQIKQNIPNKPTMIIVGKKTKTIRPKEGDYKSDFFQGMICM